MVRLTAVLAAILVILGIALYLGTGQESVTALIPSFFGAALAVCAWVGSRGERARMHAMHVSTLLALLGIGGTAGGLMEVLRSFGGEALERPAASYGRAAMAVLCALYVVLAVRSFVQARRARQA
jgi:hypothetical protein